MVEGIDREVNCMDGQTAQGALLTAGIGFLSSGMTLLLGERWWVGIIIAVVGAGFIFFREYVK